MTGDNTGSISEDQHRRDTQELLTMMRDIYGLLAVYRPMLTRINGGGILAARAARKAADNGRG